MDRNTSSLPDFLIAPIETIRLSLSSSALSSSYSLPPPPPLTATNPTLLTADLPAFITVRQQYSHTRTQQKLTRALHTLHTDSLSQLLGNERQQQRAVASMVARSAVVAVVESGMAECASEMAAMDELLGELVVRLKVLDGVVDRLPPIAAYESLATSMSVQR